MFSAAPLTPEALIELPRQPSQRVQLGVNIDDMTLAEAQHLCAQPCAWLCSWNNMPIAAIGICETFPGRQGVGWAALTSCLGVAHLALTRFAKRCIAESPLPRIEAVGRAADAEAILDQFPGLDPYQLVTAVMAIPTPECTWLRLLGMKPVHVLRKFGGAAETNMLFERIH